MIVGLGVDIVELDRIAQAFRRFGVKFAEKILAPAELKHLPEDAAAFLASRFAVKEAAVKALGTGFRNGILPCEIEVRSDPLGRSELIFHGAALARLHEMGAVRAHLSLSHGRDSAVAVVVLETDGFTPNSSRMQCE